MLDARLFSVGKNVVPPPEWRPTAAIDFDGVLHHYTGDGATTPVAVDDPPVEGAIEWLTAMREIFDVVVFSSRGRDTGDVLTVQRWLEAHGHGDIPVTAIKPIAHVYVDDRGWRFEGPGKFPDPQVLLSARPWWSEADTGADALARGLYREAVRHEPETTAFMEQAARATGGYLGGLEFRWKDPTTLAAKIKAVAERDDSTLEDAAGHVYDALRYTLIYPTIDYTDGVRAALADLPLTVQRLRNYWTGTPGSQRFLPGTYVGINAVLRTDDGFPVELQFHTPEGRAANGANQLLYQMVDDASLTPEDAQRIGDEMRANVDAVPRPEGVQNIGATAKLAAALLSVPGPTTL